ncbi:nucleotidyltransferase family protein [Sciscionella sediminilitoris]|uniref:nucleotidyltransferase family protein n=1 Tax=Sciscionella sediminilitoris TaxID=1445613 RepID=UPI0031B5B0D6
MNTPVKVPSGNGVVAADRFCGMSALLRTLTKVVSALADRGIAFAIGGGCAVYARGGPASDHDIDVFLKESDVERASKGLLDHGFDTVQPPENWLTKAYDGGVLVDMIFRPNFRSVTDELLQTAEPLRIGPARAPVLPATEVLVDKLLVLSAHFCDLAPLLVIARALREQIDWSAVAARTADSPYARAFLALVQELSVCEPIGGER